MNSNSSTQSQLDQLDALRATIADISAELELSNLLESILKRAVTLLKANGGDLGLYDEFADEIEIVASHNMGKDYQGTRMACGEGAMGLALEKRQPVMVEDYSHWENASPIYSNGRYRAVIAVPFLIGNRLLGILGVVDATPGRVFSETDKSLLTMFAQHAAIAVENARLYQTAREATKRREILHRVSQQIVSAGSDPESIYTAIHKAAVQLMPVEAFVIIEHHEANGSAQNSYLIDRGERVKTESLRPDQGLSGKVIRTGETIYIRDQRQDPERSQYQHFGDEEQTRAILAVPMRLRDKVTGMISVQSYTPNVYSNEDQSLLEMLASYAAIALDNARLFSHIQRLAITDSLTGIANRRHLFNLGHQEFLRAVRFQRPLSAIMIDIDHFKLVNDHYGHATGDYVLTRLAHLIRHEVREVDIVGRYGGEEFIIILPETELPIAMEIAERLRQKINETFSIPSKKLAQITVSIGVAENSNKTANFANLVEQADQALYAAKTAGRNRVEKHTPNA